MAGSRRVDVIFGAQFDELIAGVDTVKEKIESLAAPVQDLAASFSGIGEAIVAGLGLDRLEEFASQMNEIGERALHMSETFGIAVPEVSALNSAFQIAGLGAEAGANALIRLERAASESARGTGTAAEGFQRLGISVTDASGKLKSGTELLFEMADRVKDAPADFNRLGAVMQVVGRGLGTDLIPFLARGREGIEELIGAARDAGTSIDTEMARGMEAAAEKGRTLTAAITGLGEAIESKFHFFADFAAAWTTITEKFTQFIGATSQARLDNIFDQINQVHQALAQLRANLAESEAKGGVGFGSPAAIKAQIAALEQEFARLNEERKKIAGEMSADAASGSGPGTNPIGPAGGEGKEKDNSLAEQRDLERELNEELRQQLSLIDSTAQAQNAAFARRAADLNLEMSYGRISQSEEIEQLVQLENEKAASVEREFNLKRSLYNEDEVAYKNLLNQEEVATQQFHTRLDALYAQEIQARKTADAKAEQEWNKSMKAIERPFDQMVKGVLTGTQTIGQAMQKMWSDVALSAIESLAKITLEYGIQTALQLAGVKTAAGSEVMVHAKSAAAAVYDDVAQIPYVGWILAPPAAAAAFAAVAAFGSFDQGTMGVPHDMMAQIHQGEIVVPATFSDAIRSGQATLGGPGGASGSSAPAITIQLAPQVQDAQSFQQYINNPTTLRTLATRIMRFMPQNPQTA